MDNSNGNEASPDFDDSQISEVTYLIGKQLKFLQQHPIFSQERWTHCKVTVTTEGKLNIDFAYIEESDTWTGLYMRGISSLTEEEADRYSVPEELWEERRAQ